MATFKRPPVITILGHVDHGKTSLLDYIRQANVASREVGGITQAIGAYQIERHGQIITFIDTPGHAAFSAMRRRGGQAADIAILVVAADDAVMPQTRESIEHINNSGIPFVVAVNKIDIPGVSVDRVKTSLAEHGVYVEGYGGNIPIVPISAKNGTGIEDLLEVVLLLAELEDFPDVSAEQASALVIESSLHPQKGPLATLLVKTGVFTKNDPLYEGSRLIGKVRTMVSDRQKELLTATASTPILVLGLESVPQVGDIITNCQCETSAVVESEAAGFDVKNISIVLKADVQGSLEAIVGQIKDRVNLISCSLGAVTDGDIVHAATSGAVILGFNSKISSPVQKLAEVEKVEFKNFKIIYQMFDYIDELVNHRVKSLEPEIVKQSELKVLKVFNINNQIIYGCAVTSGKVNQTDFMTDHRIVSLKRGRTDITDAKKGEEIGLVIEPTGSYTPGDVFTTFSKINKI